MRKTVVVVSMLSHALCAVAAPQNAAKPKPFTADWLVQPVAAPPLWRTVRPVTPIFSILLMLALPIGQLVAYSAWHKADVFHYGRSFWRLDDAMVKAGGVEFPSSLGSVVTYPFLQTSGNFALMLAFMLFPVFTILERKAGHVRFLMLIGILWLTSLVAHAVQLAGCPSECAYMCGIGPIALGTIAYLHKAYPNLRFQWTKGCNIASIYLFVAAGFVLMERSFGCLRVESYSFAFLALVSCGAVGAWLGRRKVRRELVYSNRQRRKSK